ncbi:hypothetical protein Taro_028366 [Colocasia esculenta]|uniref:Uncharacterized protein n=1 Tax=Colocasia esculenta TaxID=4460 RepID=A0A843VKV9_COLES|nr:hypothetical protein [Colocasia esculenta]
MVASDRGGLGVLIPQLTPGILCSSSSSSLPSLATMKRNYSEFTEDIPPYSGPKAARETHADLKQLSAIPGHIYTRPGLQILPGQRRFSKMP